MAGAAGPPVVLLHGLGSSSADWAWQTAALQARYRVIAVDLPGHGRSALPHGPSTVESMAGAVTDLLERTTGSPAHVVGLSLGACIALRMALQGPARVRSLTLVNPFAWVRPRSPGDVIRAVTRLALLAGAPMPRLAAHVARRLFPWPEQRPLYEAAVASLATTPRAGYAAAVRALARFDARRQVAAIRRPTLVIAGDRDQVIPLDAKLALAAAIPGARVEIVPRSGHVTPVDQPEAFNRMLLEFLAGH